MQVFMVESNTLNITCTKTSQLTRDFSGPTDDHIQKDVICKVVNVEGSDDTGSLIETTQPAMGCVWKEFATLVKLQLAKINRCTPTMQFNAMQSTTLNRCTIFPQ